MLKFQENCTIENQSFEDFILLIFVLTDDFYKSVAPDSVKFRSNIEKALLSDSEIITIAICGELIGIDSEKAWFNFVKRNIASSFSKNVRPYSFQSYPQKFVAGYESHLCENFFLPQRQIFNRRQLSA